VPQHAHGVVSARASAACARRAQVEFASVHPNLTAGNSPYTMFFV